MLTLYTNAAFKSASASFPFEEVQRQKLTSGQTISRINSQLNNCTDQTIAQRRTGDDPVSGLAAPPVSGSQQQTHCGRASGQQEFDQFALSAHEQQAGCCQPQDGGATRRGVRADPHLAGKGARRHRMQPRHLTRQLRDVIFINRTLTNQRAGADFYNEGFHRWSVVGGRWSVVGDRWSVIGDR